MADAARTKIYKLFSKVPGRESGRFLKKAAQKLLLAWARGAETSTAQFNKVFLLLFVHKKKPFPSPAYRVP